MRRTASTFLSEASGAVSIEYALIVALIGVGVFTSVTGVGAAVRVLYDAILAAFTSI